MSTSEFLKSLVQAFLKRQEATEPKYAKVEMLASAGAYLLYIMLLHRLFQINLESDNPINGGNNGRLFSLRTGEIWLPTPMRHGGTHIRDNGFFILWNGSARLSLSPPDPPYPVKCHVLRERERGHNPHVFAMCLRQTSDTVH